MISNTVAGVRAEASSEQELHRTTKMSPTPRVAPGIPLLLATAGLTGSTAYVPVVLYPDGRFEPRAKVCVRRSRFQTHGPLGCGLQYFHKRPTDGAGRIGDAQDRGERGSDVHGGNFTEHSLGRNSGADKDDPY